MSSSLGNLLGIENLTKAQIREYLDLGRFFKKAQENDSKKLDLLANKTIVGLFYEASTRTRSSFEMAAKRLGADFINISADSSTSIAKGESLVDTAGTLQAMHPNLLILRHQSAGAPVLLASKLKIPVVNAGDGFHEHPTQALLDAMTIEEHFGSLNGLTVAIFGDIAHSRVARSNIHLLRTMGASVIVCGPPTLIPPGPAESLGVEVTTDMKQALRRADVVMMLRIQFERQNQKQFPSKQEYTRFYGLNAEKARYMRPGAIIMHPGPMNRGVEISPDLADGKHSVILHQVGNGVAIRMGVMAKLLGAKPAGFKGGAK